MQETWTIGKQKGRKIKNLRPFQLLFIFSKRPDGFYVTEKFPCYSPDDSICRYSHEHSEHTAYLSGEKEYNENLQRVDLHAVRINEWLEKIIVNHLGKDEYAYQYGNERQEANAQAE